MILVAIRLPITGDSAQVFNIPAKAYYPGASKLYNNRGRVLATQQLHNQVAEENALYFAVISVHNFDGTGYQVFNGYDAAGKARVS